MSAAIAMAAAGPREGAARGRRWRLERWGTARVAGLSADVLPALRLAGAAAADEALARAEAELEAAQRAAAERAHAEVGGCEDRELRRALLDVKRRLFNGKPASLPAAVAQGASEALRGELARVERLSTARAEASRAFEEAFAAGWQAASAALRRCLSDEAVARGMLLSSPDLRCAAEHLLARPAGKPPTAAEQIREAALARYVFRAATRTTPFSSFAAAALLDWHDGDLDLDLDLDRGLARARPGELTYESRPQIHAGALQAWLTRTLSPEAAARLPLRLNPLRYRDEGAPPALVFAQAGVAADAPGAAPRLGFGLSSLDLTPGVERVLRLAAGRSEVEAAAALAAEGHDPAAARRVLAELVRLGVLERVLPRPGADPSALEALARALRGIDAAAADRVALLAGHLARYGGAPARERAAVLAAIERELGPHGQRAALVEDVSVRGLAPGDFPAPPADLAADLEPALALARASASRRTHRLLTEAFLSAYGPAGTCNDVPRFITSVVTNGALMRALRFSQDPIAWMAAPLGRAVASAEGDRCALDPALFEARALPATCDRLAVSAFVQLAARPGSPDVAVVLNGLQSGRYKYLSRFLAEGDAAAREARARLAAEGGPRPVEIDAGLGLNFQLHPPLTAAAIELPFEAVAEDRPAVRLSELSLRYDPAASELRVCSLALGCDIEPIHLGFLRDTNLPDPLFVLRALSPRIADETVAERADLYNLLDARDLAAGRRLRDHRPRLEVGRLVLERARWAVPAEEIPRKAASERYSSFFRRVAAFRRARGLPERGFARHVASGGGAVAALAASRMLIDWSSPATLAGLDRLLGPKDAAAPGWLVITELLPEPEAAPLRIGGRPHVAELVVQLRWEADRAP
ncbi:lantibiotic dehydratase [Sorangium sp. So ce131]|uniref:lantibiotic dehydratase n=1 Tax=Sorangium sp. So ce131 TaxID=3133282 RepID=UPI003F61DC0A